MVCCYNLSAKVKLDNIWRGFLAKSLYCHSCATHLGLIQPSDFITLTGTSYQLEKYVKHTVPTGTYSINSVFADPTYEKYSQYVVTTMASGSAVVDERGRVNLLWIAGEQTGATYEDDDLVLPTNGVFVVWHEDETKIHAFPVDTTQFTDARCQCCGRQIYTEVI